MNDQRGVRRRGGAIVVKYDGRSLMPVPDIDNQSKLKLLYLGTCLIIGYIYLMKLLKLKHQGEKESPSEKLRFFLMCIYSLVLIKVGHSLAMLCYDFGRSLYKKFFPRRV